jgi:predicted nuclease of predicted toxin-antitoxin system
VKDADFRQLSFLFGHPPRTVWLRIGNSPTSVAADLLRSSSLVIAGFLDDAESALLILPAID